MRVLMVTSEWPTDERPGAVPFLVQRVRALREAGIQVELFSFRGSKDPLRYLRAWAELRRHYSFRSFDVFHAQFGQSGLLALPVCMPMVVTFRGSDLQGYVVKGNSYSAGSFLLRLASRVVARSSTKCILVSDHLKVYLPSGMNVEIIPSGIDLQLFRPMSKERARKFLGLSDGKFLVLFASDPRRLVKRFSLAKEAIRLLESRLNIELVVTSKVPHSKMPLYMNACDALVLTSKHEGSPNVIKEALACNLPIVSVDVGDVREYISKLKGCVLCKDDSPNTIARGLMSVLEGNRLIKGRQAVKELDETILVWKLIGVYQSVLNEKI